METKTLTNGIAMVLQRAGSVQEKAYSVQGEAHVIASEAKQSSLEIATSQDAPRNDKETFKSKFLSLDTESVIASEAKQSFSQSLITNHESQIVNDDEGQVLADKVLASAKEEGFEEALTHLADGDFKKEKESLEINEIDLELPENDIIDEPVITLEMQFNAERLQILEEKVKDLTEQNKEFAYKIKNLETQKAQELFSLAELIRIYEEWIESAPSVEEKVGFLEILMDILKEFAKGLMEPDGEVDQKPQPVEEVEKPTFMQFLKAFQASRQY